VNRLFRIPFSFSSRRTLSLHGPIFEFQVRSENASFIEAVTEANVQRAVALVPERSAVLRDLLESGMVDVVGAVYDVGTGAVRFLEESRAALHGAAEPADDRTVHVLG
jgi:carbonic anhydrase